jgi:hypothetical protein
MVVPPNIPKSSKSLDLSIESYGDLGFPSRMGKSLAVPQAAKTTGAELPAGAPPGGEDKLR